MSPRFFDSWNLKRRDDWARQDENFPPSIFNSVTDPLALYDRNFQVLRINQAFMTMHQLSAEPVIGRKCYEVFHGRSAICEKCHVQEVFATGEPRSREMLLSLPYGEQRFFEVHAYPIKDSRGTTIQVIEHGRDITWRKNLKRQLKASEEKYRTIVEMAREGIFTVDAEARFTFANESMARMLGYRPEEIIGRSAFDFMEEEAKNIAKAQFEQRRQGVADTYELNLKRKDGAGLVNLVSAAPLMVNGAFLGSIGVFTDITQLKQVEAELRTAKEFEEKIINSITDNLIIIDPRTHRIVQANDSFLARVGLESQAVVARPCYEVMLGRTRPCAEDGISCPVQETARLKREASSHKAYPDIQGQERIFQINTFPFFNAQGEVELVVRLERDATDKRRMEEALAFRTRELEKTQLQLEKLFEISREGSAKNSIPELIHFLHGVTLEIFPESDPMFFLLDAGKQQFLPLAECPPYVTEPTQRLLGRLEQPGLVADFVQYLGKNKDPQIITFAEPNSQVPFMKLISQTYPSWFGLPILAQQHGVGYFLLGSHTFREYSREDLHFIHALFAQVGGYLGHLVQDELEINHRTQELSRPTSYGEIIGQSKEMQEVYDLIDLVSGTDATVLITGDNGTGKELVAQSIHRQSKRNRGPFVVANCSAYSPTLLESELFGHEKGAFTGAIRRKKGRFELAQRGTLFLDEIGDIPPATQVLLLRFLQDHCFERVGGEVTIEADVRVLVATNKDLYREIRAGRFRDDLYYRLNVISIHLPSLKQRKEDIPLLCQHFLNKYNLKEGKKITRFSSNALQSLLDFDWPGNVRQLENAISHAVILAKGEVIRRKHLPRFLKEGSEGTISSSLTENERRLVFRILQEVSWNKHEAARRLRISRSTLYGKIRRFGLKEGITLD
ncbi:MAG: sigma-54-dependent Fis family transcriptional regulator [Desulfobaccales bacterium]|nr:sigma-54-dependent Fis family transcriptional regulator [Desulfobaccales bacterium]